MKIKPFIIVRLVHIEGPLKGQIQEFSNSEIIIGRHPSCQVQFPVDYNTISRKHAKIYRDGNRFRFIDHSTNGTYLNGKETKDAILKDGDVLMFSKGGPKISFLTQVVDTPLNVEPKPVSHFSEPEPVFDNKMAVDSEKSEKPVIMQRNELSSPMKGTPKDIQKPQRVKMPISIVFGPRLQTFNELPIIIGKSADCDFKIEHSHIYDHHITIYFIDEQYWVKDLTGMQLVMVNGKPIDIQMPLIENCILSLTPKGPEFKFLGQGRLIEVEDSVLSKNEVDEEFQDDLDKDSFKSKKPSIIKKFWKR